MPETPAESQDPEAPISPAGTPAAATKTPTPGPLATPASTPGSPPEEASAVPASSDSERSAESCADGPGGALYARVARPARARVQALSLSPSPERQKPPPPDPATKPKVSWIHGKQQGAPSPAPSPGPRRRTPSGGEEPGHVVPSPPRARLRGRGLGLAENTEAGGSPCSAPDAASLLAAELRDKTRSLGAREKPAPPQKAKRSVPTRAVASAVAAPEAPASDDIPRKKKTPIQKPPRKKCREVGAPTL